MFKAISSIFIITLFAMQILAQESEIIKIRSNWKQDIEKFKKSSKDSGLVYLKYYNNLPEEINLEIFKNRDLSKLTGKNLFLGYGTVDKKGKDCKSFSSDITGYDKNTTVCLPYWRIEREYAKTASKTNFKDAIALLPTPKPPIVAKVCDKYSDDKKYPGGKVTCFAYFDKLAGGDCYSSPLKKECYVNTCSNNIDKKCTFVDVVIGEEQKLSSATIKKDGGAPEEEVTKVKLSTFQYKCPAGPLVKNVNCVDERVVLMYPANCADKNSTNTEDAYEYCKKSNTNRDNQGNIISFYGICKNGKPKLCETKKFSSKSLQCIEPIYEEIETTQTYQEVLRKSYKDYEIDWGGGETDFYSENKNCLRTNTTRESRSKTIFVDMKANGFIENSIYIMKHKENGGDSKIYCNTGKKIDNGYVSKKSDDQLRTCILDSNLTFNSGALWYAKTCALKYSTLSEIDFKNCIENTNVKEIVQNKYTTTSDSDYSKYLSCFQRKKSSPLPIIYNNLLINCETNNGTFSLDKRGIEVAGDEIISIQQAFEPRSKEFYQASEVRGKVRDGANIIKKSRMGAIKGKTTNTQRFLKPRYMYFTHPSATRRKFRNSPIFVNEKEVLPEISSTTDLYRLGLNDFSKILENSIFSLSLIFPFSGTYELSFYNKRGKEIIKKTINDSNFNATYSSLNIAKNMKLSPKIQPATSGINDKWVEIGGGIYGGRTKDGHKVQRPDREFVKENAITSILIKNIANGSVTPIVLAFPLIFPNKISISKLNAYEKRKYRCYNNFQTSKDVGKSSTKFLCSLNKDWQDYKKGNNVNFKDIISWDSREICSQNCRELKKCIKSNDIFLCEENGLTSTSNSQCEINCFRQNRCEANIQSPCKITKQKLSYPISDFTGKTVYTQSDSAVACKEKKKKIVGCKKYKTKNVSGTLNYSFGDIGVERLNPVPFEDAISKMNMLNMPTHLWSGWYGNCMDGMKMDSSYLSDPLTVANYALSAYSAYKFLGGTSISDYANSWSASKETTKAASSATSVTKTSTFLTKTGDFLKTKVVDNSFAVIDNADLIQFGVQTSLIMAAPSEKDYTKAKNVIAGLAGDNSSSDVAQYNSCMASIGLSLPNILGWNFQDVKNTSKQLIEPWNSPLQMTPKQLVILSSIHGEDWVINNFRMDDSYKYIKEHNETIEIDNNTSFNVTDNNITQDHNHTIIIPQTLQVVALTGESYVTAGQTICLGGKVAGAMNQMLNSREPSVPSMPNQNGQKAAKLAITAIGLVNPVLALAMTVAIDLYNNMLAEVDTCKNKSEAITVNMLQYKTNLFYNFGQCHDIRRRCTARLFTKTCVQHTYDKCCYDSSLTRIFAEGTKEQLKRKWVKNVNRKDIYLCNDTSISDFKNISLRTCKKGEIPSRDKCFSYDKYSEFKATLLMQAAKNMQDDTQGLLNQVTDSMILK